MYCWDCCFCVVVLLADCGRDQSAAGQRRHSSGCPPAGGWHGRRLDVQLLTVPTSIRSPGIALEQIDGIVIHYTANPGTSAQANRDYFEGLKDSHATKASAHFIVGLDGRDHPVHSLPRRSPMRPMTATAITLSIECCYEKGRRLF